MTKIKLSFFTLFFLSAYFLCAENFTIQSYDVKVNLHTDGSATVEEVIKLNFHKSSRGIFREIPMKYKFEDQTQKLLLGEVSVEGHPHVIKTSGSNYIIRIGDRNVYLDGDQVYRLTYTLENLILKASDHHAFQYNLIADWDTTIDSVSYEVILPENIDLRYYDYRIFTGQDGADERNASIQKSRNKIYGSSYSPLAPNENITIAIKFPVDYFKFPPPPPPIYTTDKTWLPTLFLPFLAIFGFIKFRQKPDLPLTSAPTYYPPDNISPSELGTFLDGRVHVRDLIALLPFWANKGLIQIVDQSAGVKDNNLYFKKVKQIPDDFPEYQKIIYNKIFEDTDFVALSELDKKIYTVIGPARKAIKNLLHERDLYDSREKQLFHSPTILWSSLGLVVLSITIMAAFGWVLTGLCLILTAIVLFVIYFIPPKRSEKGRLLNNKIKHFSEFLKHGDEQQMSAISRQDQHYFLMLFPYAIALGIDKEWMARLESFDLPAPYWYTSDNSSLASQPRFADFSQQFDVAHISSVFSSMPRSSGGSGGYSGGSSGGFSGGGVGGGGGSW